MGRAATEPPRDRRAVPFPVVFGSALAALLAALLGAWFAYRQLIHYEPRAARHLWPGAELAARLDVEQVILFEPVRRHLLPFANTPLAGSAGVAANARATVADPERHALDRLRALREMAGLNLGRDLREIAVARSGSGAWVIALGGLFPDRGLVAGVERVLRQEGVQTLRRFGAGLELSPGGAAVGQAEDGVLIVASSREILESALPENHEYRRLGMPLAGDGSLVVGNDCIRRWGERVGSRSNLPRALVATLKLARPLRVEVALPGSNLEAVRSMFASAQRSVGFESTSPAPFPVTDWEAERALLARARVEVDTQGEPIIATSMELSELHSGLEWVGARIERGLSAPFQG